MRISFPQVQERFGVSVAVEGDVVVGGAYNNSSSQSFGSVYVFTKQTSWTDVTQSAVLVTAANVQGDGFGNAVAVEQDIIAVGAVRTRLPIPGKVYIYQRGGDTWADMTETAVLSPSINTTSNFFGFVVDLDGGVLVAGDQSTENCRGVIRCSVFI